MSENRQDKTEQATPYKLRKLKEQGTIHKSIEISNLVVYLVITLICIGAGQSLFIKGLVAMQGTFAQQLNHIDLNSQIGVTDYLSNLLYLIIAPLFVLVGAVLGVSLMQTGFIWASDSIKFKMQRMNPFQGIKKIINRQMPFTIFKVVIKMALFAAVVYFIVAAQQQSFILSKNFSLIDNSQIFIQKLGQLLMLFSFAYFMIALIDYIYTRHDYLKRHRMSKQEIKEEMIRRDGHPEIKNKRKQLLKKLLSKERK